MFFALDTYLLKNMGRKHCFAFQHIGHRKRFTEVLFTHPRPIPRDQTYLFAYSCGFTFNTSYKNGMVTQGYDVKMLKKQFITKKYFELILNKSVGKYQFNGIYQGFSYDCVPIN